MGERQQGHQDVVGAVADLVGVAPQILQELASRFDDALGVPRGAGGPHDQGVGQVAPGVEGQAPAEGRAARGGDQQLVQGDGPQFGVDGRVVVDEDQFRAGAPGDAAGLLGACLLVDEDDGRPGVHESEEGGHIGGRVPRLEDDPLTGCDTPLGEHIGKSKNVVLEFRQRLHRVGCEYLGGHSARSLPRPDRARTQHELQGPARETMVSRAGLGNPYVCP